MLGDTKKGHVSLDQSDYRVIKSLAVLHGHSPSQEAARLIRLGIDTLTAPEREVARHATSFVSA